ncbi:MAG TPA: hypothetical protein VGG22_13090 [Candidatus Baltobacteraceae bacterium]|jgi:hypothetical protein
MFLRSNAPQTNGTHAILEREQLTLSNVQIDSWLLQADESAFDVPLRSIIAKYQWRRPESIEITRSSYGRTYLREDVLGRPLYLGIACSMALGVVIISREARIGIELVSPLDADRLMPAIEDSICVQERDLITGLSPAARRRALLAIWSRKRALQAANSVVEQSPLQTIAVGLGELALELPASFGWLDRWRVHGFTLRGGELGSIAVYNHDQLLVIGAGERRTGVKKGTFAGYERRH